MANDDLARLTLPVGARDHAQGPADAPVTLVEYGDYECPHCGRAYPIVKDVQRRLGSKLRFVFRNFPLEREPSSRRTRRGSGRGAGAHGRFWEMHDTLFEHQQALLDRDLVGYATAVGLDATVFENELRAHTYKARVREDFTGGVRSGVNGTPTFFINGVRFDDSWDPDTLTEALLAVAGRSR